MFEGIRMNIRLGFCGSAFSTITCILVLAANAHSAKLTGAFTFSCDTNGHPAGHFAWDTRGSESDFYKVFVTGGTPGGSPDGLTSAFINGPGWSQAPLNIDLTEGTQQFTVFFQDNGPWPTFGLNLFFENSQVAQICVKGPARTGEAIPSFSANSAPSTYSMTSFPSPNAPASGSLRADFGEWAVELTEYYVAATNLFGSDRVGTHSTGANGRFDYVGTFTLVVTGSIPPPPPPETGPRLTGAFTLSTDAGGNPAGNFAWDTRGLESDFYKVWLTQGTPEGDPDGLTTSFLNGPTSSRAPISIPLQEGTHRFTMFFQDNGPWPRFGLNLFFQGSEVAQICVKGDARTGEAIPPFTANSAPVTYSMTSFPYPNAPASGRTRAVFEGLMVEVTEYYVAASSLFSMDRVDTHSTGANGRLDYVGTFTLVVQATDITAPTIETHPESQTVDVGAEVTFHVRAEGTPPLAYQWLKNGNPIAGATAPDLTLHNVQVSDAGDYSARVSNNAGSVTSNPATLTVNPPPPDPTPRLTGAFTFSCDHDGSPAGDFAWDTRGLESDYYKVWLTRGTPGGSPDGLTSDFVNGPDWAHAPLNIPLQEGTYEFTIFFQDNGPWPTFGLNLFFQDSSVAQICVQGDARTGEVIPPFTPNHAPVTYSMTSFPSPDAPASGRRRARVGDMVVEVTDYYVSATNLFSADRVDTHSTGPNGRLDYIGTFTLRVRPRDMGNNPPSASIQVGSSLVLSPMQAHPFVIACDGKGAAVTLDASGSSDADGDPLTFEWLTGPVSPPVSGTNTTSDTAAIGTHTVTLRVSDGIDESTTSLTFEVITPAEAVAAIGAVLDSAELSLKALRPLEAALLEAVILAKAGNCTAAKDQLRVLQSKVEAQLAGLTAGQTLLNAAEAVIDALTCADQE
jgi:Ig-like domain-containing protein/PKD domain-containing protein